MRTEDGRDERRHQSGLEKKGVGVKTSVLYSVGGALGFQRDHVRDLALAVAVARHDDKVVQRVGLETEDSVVDAAVQ